jgi:hypothetical protein
MIAEVTAAEVPLLVLLSICFVAGVVALIMALRGP